MSLRFFRSIRIAPGVHVNLGLHGAGLSVGLRGLHLGVNRCGVYTSAGIPGTGIYAVHHIRRSSGEHPKVCGKRLAGDPAACCAALRLVRKGVLVNLFPSRESLAGLVSVIEDIDLKAALTTPGM
jgi:hypothetical protein